MDWPHMQIDSLQTVEGSFHSGETFVTGHNLLARQRFLPHAGADNVNPIQSFFAFDVGRFAFVVKTVVFDAQLKVLAHFVAVENLACAHPDILLTAKRALGAPSGSGDFLQLLLGGCQQFGSFARALFRQQRIEARNQALAGKVRMRDFDQIGLVEEGHLQLATGGQFLDLAGA